MDEVLFVPVGVITELERVTLAVYVLWVSATLETVEEIEVCDVGETVDEIELPETDEPRELEMPLEVEVPEFDAVVPMIFAEYVTIPAAAATTTIATIHVGRMNHCCCGHSFLNPWCQSSIGAIAPFLVLVSCSLR